MSVVKSVKGLAAGRYYYDLKDSGSVNRDFGKVVPGNIYCVYSLKDRFYPDPLGFIIILEMPTETDLKIERLNNNSCGKAKYHFSSNATEFER